MLQLDDIFKNDEAALLFIDQKGLLYNGGECDTSGGIFQIYKKNSTYSGAILKCTKCNCQKSLFYKSFFTRAQIPVCKNLRIIYCWSQQFSRLLMSAKSANKQLQTTFKHYVKLAPIGQILMAKTQSEVLA